MPEITLKLKYTSLAEMRRDMESFLWPLAEPRAVAAKPPKVATAKKPDPVAVVVPKVADPAPGEKADPALVEKGGFKIDPVLAAVPIETLLTDPQLPELPDTVPVRPDYAGLVPGEVDSEEEETPRRGRGRPPGSRNRRGFELAPETQRPPVQSIPPLPPIGMVELDPAMTLAPETAGETEGASGEDPTADAPEQLTAYDIAMGLGGEPDLAADDPLAAARLDLDVYFNRLIHNGNHAMALGLLRGAVGNDRLNGLDSVPDEMVAPALQALRSYLDPESQ